VRTVTRAFLRYLPRRRALTSLQLLGIAVGVAAAVGMALSARAALASFGKAVDFLRGRASHTLSRPAGPMEEGLLMRLMADPAVAAFSPVIDRRVELVSGDRVRVIGVDPFLDRPFRPYFEPAETGGEMSDFLFEAGAVLAAADLAKRQEFTPGAEVETVQGAFRVIGTFPNPAGEPLFVMDIGHAQEFFGLTGYVDRVDLILDDEEGFRIRWSAGFDVRSAGQSRATMEQMLRAFRLNLEALSLLGLFVGVFLVYNTAMFAVVSRRRDAGILFSLGARRREVGLAFLAEFLLVGGAGGFLGAVLGYGLSRFLTALVGGAISNVYFFLRPAPPAWSWGIAGLGVALGWGASLLGGAYPLAELVRTDPVAALRGRAYRRSSQRRARQLAWVGAGVLALSVALFPPASLHVYAGFAGAFGMLVAVSLACGVALDACGPALERLGSWAAGLPGRIAMGNVRRNLGRTAVAVAAFTVALSMSVGLGLMIGSFRESLGWWMDGQLTGDLYVAPSAEIQVPEDFYREVAALPEVAGVDPYRFERVLYQGAPINVASVDASVLERFAHFGWYQGGDEAWQAVQRGSVIVSESFCRRFGLGAGDWVTLAATVGPVELQIAGVFYDYTTERGLVMMDRSTYRLIYRDPTIDSLAVFLKGGRGTTRETIAEIRRRAADRRLPVRTRDELHRDILGVFDATFSVTRSMRMLAVIVAFFGIAGALLTLYMERQREFGIYRALGFSTPQVAAMTLLEGVGMGAVSLALSVVVGTALAFVLIRVINLQSFYWTVFFHPAWLPYLTAAVIAAAASVGAAAYPIWRICRTFPQMQIREE